MVYQPIKNKLVMRWALRSTVMLLRLVVAQYSWLLVVAEKLLYLNETWSLFFLLLACDHGKVLERRGRNAGRRNNDDHANGCANLHKHGHQHVLLMVLLCGTTSQQAIHQSQ